MKPASAPLVEIDISLLAYNVGVTTTNTLDLGQGVHDFALSIDVGVEQTQDMLELLVSFRDDKRHAETEQKVKSVIRLFQVESSHRNAIPLDLTRNLDWRDNNQQVWHRSEVNSTHLVFFGVFSLRREVESESK